MKKFMLPAALLFLAGASFAAKPTGEHFKGYISDSKCVANKTDMGALEHREHCVSMCLKGGASAMLVVGDKAYKIANQKKVKKYAGENVEVEGTVSGDTITVDKISEDKG